MNSKTFAVFLLVFSNCLFFLFSCDHLNPSGNVDAQGSSDSNILHLPNVSQLSSVHQTIGISDIGITYYRPNVKGRNIWGNIVKYDTVWAVGAEYATQFHFTDTAYINGYKLPKEDYYFFIVPRSEGPCTLIFNSQPNQFSNRQYDSKNNVLSFNVQPLSATFTETLTFDVSDVSVDAAQVSMKWENKQVNFPV